MIAAVQLNIPDWTVYVGALVALAVPLIISYVLNRFRQAEDE